MYILHCIVNMIMRNCSNDTRVNAEDLQLLLLVFRDCRKCFRARVIMKQIVTVIVVK